MIDEILSERKGNYGDFEALADLSQKLKDCVREHPNFLEMKPFQKEAIEMILHKIARSVNGNPDYVETWRDKSGYSQLVFNILQKTEGATDCRGVKQIVKDGKMIDIYL